jgi:cation transport ATPase
MQVLSSEDIDFFFFSISLVGFEFRGALFFFFLLGVQVPAVLDATIDVGGGKVNIHVLMAFAALASVFMGNALEGGLLLAMFSLSHLGK